MVIELTYDRVAIATLLILINGGISLALKLDLERRLVVAAFATVVQLLLIGLILDWIFRVNRWYVVLGLMLLMTIVAGSAAIRRTHIRYPGIWLSSVIMFLIASGTALGTVSVVLLNYRRLFNRSHQFLYQLVKER